MRSVVFKLGRRSRKRRRKDRDEKTFALSEAGVRLLALKDYDALSMQKVAREAGISVGSLYARYPDKNSYLYHLIADAFRSMLDDAKLTLNPGRWRRESAAFVARQVVVHVVAKMSAPRPAGVIRACLKLATVKPRTIELFEEYRTEVTKLAVDLLAPRMGSGASRTIRVGMQIVLGTVTDAVMQKRPGPMNAGSARMTEALTNVFLGYLGLSASGAWAGEEAESEDEPDEPMIPEEEIEEEEASNRLFDPDLKVYKGRIAKPLIATRRRKRKEPEPAPRIQVVKPPKTPSPPKEEPPLPPPRRKHIFI